MNFETIKEWCKNKDYSFYDFSDGVDVNIFKTLEYIKEYIIENSNSSVSTGNLMIIKNDDDKSVLINVGIISQYANDINRKILPVVKYLNIKKFNWLIGSRGNSFHQIGKAKAIENIPIDTVWDVGLDPNSSFDSYTRSMIELKNIDYNIMHRGDIIRIDEQSYIQFLLPINNIQTEKSQLAFQLVNGSNSILFIEKLNDSELDVLTNDGEAIKSDVLKMTYPKQILQKFDEFIQMVNPKMTIITGGKSGKYSPTVDEIDELFDSELFFTDSVGAVWLSSDGKNPIKVKEWK